MAKFQFINHFSATLSSAIGETDTTLSWSSTTADAFTIEDGGYVPLTLLNPASPGSYEVVYATSITSTTLVVLRGKEGSAASWAAGSTIVCAPTASVLGLSSLAGSQHQWSQATASLIGGYQKYALVVGPDGNLWQSTSDANVSTPGAEGATWQSLFDGYATQTWANGQFLQLALATLQTVAGPVAFSGKTTVPGVSAFTGTEALNAETAEGRYVRSVPAADGTNVRIVDVQVDASGNLVATLQDGSTEQYAPVSYGVFTPSGSLLSGSWVKIGNRLRQRFTLSTGAGGVGGSAVSAIVWPLAFSDNDVNVLFSASRQNQVGGAYATTFVNIYRKGQPYGPTATGASFTMYDELLNPVGPNNIDLTIDVEGPVE